MPKYECYVQRVARGTVTVEGGSEEEAEREAQLAHAKGLVDWHEWDKPIAVNVVKVEGKEDWS